MSVLRSSGVPYRGYLICIRAVELSGCDRIRRPDGSWRYSPPTDFGVAVEWVIAKELEPGIFQEFDVAPSEEEAKQKVDRLLNEAM